MANVIEKRECVVKILNAIVVDCINKNAEGVRKGSIRLEMATSSLNDPNADHYVKALKSKRAFEAQRQTSKDFISYLKQENENVPRRRVHWPEFPIQNIVSEYEE